MVAILNYEPRFSAKNIGTLERHNQTDEVFILTKGRAVLIIGGKKKKPQEIEILPAEKNVVYNVLKGVWHGLVMSRNATFIIVEKRDTNLNDVELAELSSAQISTIKKKMGSLELYARKK